MGGLCNCSLPQAKKEAEANLETALAEVTNSQKARKDLEAQLQSQMSQVSAKEDTMRLLTYEKESLQKQLGKYTVAMDSLLWIASAIRLSYKHQLIFGKALIR